MKFKNRCSFTCSNLNRGWKGKRVFKDMAVTCLSQTRESEPVIMLVRYILYPVNKKAFMFLKEFSYIWF